MIPIVIIKWLVIMVAIYLIFIVGAWYWPVQPLLKKANYATIKTFKDKWFGIGVVIAFVWSSFITLKSMSPLDKLDKFKKFKHLSKLKKFAKR
jgi:hypothetical protein